MRETLVEGPDPLLGARVAGRYTVMRRIARGGMGVVYLAVQEGLGRAVALKIIRAEAAGDPIMQKRFEREAKAVSQLGHPAIVTVHDFGRTDDGALFLAMEFVDGEVLRDALKRKRRFSFIETLPIVECIASALARAHAAGVVHRDLKPENVMLPKSTATTTGAVAAKVLDFGLAKPHDPDQVDEHLTRDGGFVGTPGYASPEQAEGAQESPQQDLYALGVLWFELLSGEHPFSAPTPMKVVVRQLNEEPPSLDGKLPDVPATAVTLIRRLMARRADDRPGSAQRVLEEIAALKDITRSTPSPSAAPPALPSGSAASALFAASSVDAPTVDGMRAPGQGGLAFAPTVTTPPKPLPADSIAKSSSAGEGSHRGLFLGGLLVVAVLAGAVVVFVINAPELWSDFRDKSSADAGVDEPIVDDGDILTATPPVEVPKGIEIVLEKIPTFSAMQGVRTLFNESKLDVYTLERSVLYVDAPDAAPLAEMMQGVALRGDVPLVLEVKELSRGRIVAVAVRPEDASALQDAGLLYDGGALPDGGPLDDVEAPGGLAP